LAPALVAILWLGACTDTVYRDRPPFNPPPDAASGFLGYYTVADGQTTCGNCHVGQQGDWSQTKHASAWGDLQASPYLDATCAGAFCHTVNWRGNQDSARVGYEAVQSAAYHDVQCENCHGPGLTHVENPTIQANQPLASINVTDDPALADRSCSGCHRGGAGPDRHQNYLAEWKSSRHGQLRANQAAEADCQPCHEAKGALRAWGVITNYKEIGTNTNMPQNCVVCHDPHGTATDDAGTPFEGQLRFSISTPVIAENLCTKCHGRVDRSEATPTNSRGPHGAQGPVLFGSAGYFPPGTIYDTTEIITTHGSTANPRLCAGCHVNKLTGRDASGNKVQFSGHTFHPLPCLQTKSGADTIVDPTYTNACAYDEPSRSWAACATSGCHGTEAVAVSRLTGIRTERDGYLNTIWQDLNGNRSVNASPTDGGYLASIMAAAPGELRFTCTPATCPTHQDTLDMSRLTPAKGALFNVQLLGESLASHPDGSHGVHNPFLYRALLQSTIADLQANYGAILPAPPAPVLAQIQAALQSGKLKLAPKLEQAIMNPNLANRPAVNRAGSR
jgi:hypothetical protein